MPCTMGPLWRCLCTLALLWMIDTGHATAPDSMGREFVFSFTTPPSETYHRPVQYVMITTTSLEPIRVNTSVPGVGFTNSTVVSRHVMGNVSLPVTVFPSGNGKYNKCIIIKADGIISVHGMYAMDYTVYRHSAGFLVMPTPMLGNNYIVASYTPYSASYPAQLTITALAHETRVTIAKRIDGGNEDIVLQPYESYQLTSEFDLTGSTIVGDQPISVMSGIECVNIPHGASYDSCNYMVTHLMDTKSFGNQFVLAPFMGRSRGYVFRVIASDMETRMEINSEQSEQIVTELDSGDFYSGDSLDITTISTNKPVLVVQFAKNGEGGVFGGGPFMVTVPPISMFDSGKLVVFPVAAFPTNSDQKYYISVTIPCEHKDTLQVNDVRAEWNDTLWTPNSTIDQFSGQFCVLRKEVTSGVHSVSHVSEDVYLSVLVYGVWRYSAYAYNTGFIRRVTAVMSSDIKQVDNIESRDDEIVRSSIGRKFVFSVLTPRYNSYRSGFYVMITTTSSSSVHVNTSIPGVGFTNSTVVSRHVLGNVSLPTSVFPSGDGIYNKCVIIRSDGDISVHGMYGYGGYYYDEQAAGFPVMPTTMIGKKYILASYVPNSYYPAESTVTALDYQTHAKINIKNGGADIDLVLQPYESYQITSAFDLTGSTIVADRPVSVMSGVECAGIPINRNHYCEFIAIHLMDTHSYGTQYVLGPFPGQSLEYIFRVIATERSSTIDIFEDQSEQRIIDLDNGHLYEGKSKNIIYLSSNKPVMVVQYPLGFFTSYTDTDSSPDPSMIIVPPISVFPTSVVFPVTRVPTSNPQYTYISVTSLCKYSDNIVVDGEYTEWNEILVSSTELESQFCVHHKVVNPGVHSVDRFPEEGFFSVIVTGVSMSSSYAYPVGFSNTHNKKRVDTIHEHGISLLCGPTTMTVLVDRRLVRDGRVTDVHLTDSRCHARYSRAALKLQANYDECGTMKEVTENKSVFRNRLIYNPPSVDVRRDSTFDVPLVCDAGFSGIVSMGNIQSEYTRIKTAVQNTREFGTNLTLRFQLYRDQTYNTTYQNSDFPLEVGVLQRLYFAVAMSYSEDELLPIEVVVKDVIVTPSPDPNDEMKYFFIDNRCREDGSVIFHKPDSPLFNRFSMSAVKFEGNFSEMYIHCWVLVCNSSESDTPCKRSCHHRYQRDTSREHNTEYGLMRGPFIIRRRSQQKGLAATGNSWSWTHIAIVLLPLATVINVGVWLGKYFNRRRRNTNTLISCPLESIEMKKHEKE